MEVWKEVKDYEGLYEVSNLGRVKRLSKWTKVGNVAKRFDKEKILKQGLHHKGYFHVILSKNGKSKTITTHRLVLSNFVENIENKHSINHINGIKTDNRLENLEWCTISENSIHSYKMGLQISIKGEKHGRSKLTKNQVIDIKYNLNSLTNSEISKIYNLSKSYVWCLRRGKTWKHI
jgi:hypothetical protein